jgi:hypothetical protein
MQFGDRHSVRQAWSFRLEQPMGANRTPSPCLPVSPGLVRVLLTFSSSHFQLDMPSFFSP